MPEENYNGTERRQSPRVDHATPLDYKICKEETIKKLLCGYTANVSAEGISCHLKDNVSLNDILWLSFDHETLECCAQIEKNALIYQNGIIGKVVRVTLGEPGVFMVGIQFLTREEMNSTHIYPKIHFLMKEI